MKRETALILAIVLGIWLLVLAGLANGATFSFENRGNKTATYILNWCDHPFPTWACANVAAGDLDVGVSRATSYDIPGRVFEVKFFNKYGNVVIDYFLFDVNNHAHVVWDGRDFGVEVVGRFRNGVVLE